MTDETGLDLVVIFQSYTIFGGYLKHVREALKSPDRNSFFLKEALEVGYKKYKANDPKKTRSDYTKFMELAM